MVNIDFSTIIGAYTTVIGDPLLVGLFMLSIGLIFSVRLGVSIPFILSSGLVLIYLLTSAAGGMSYIPLGAYLVMLFVSGIIIYFALKKLESNF